MKTLYKTLHIIMPMAGEGSRFKDAGYKTPKPLVKVFNKPLFVNAINSLANLHKYKFINIEYTFIVRKEHIDKFHIDEVILSYFRKAHIISVEKTTGGAVETCMLAKPYIKDNQSILVMDCDLWFKSKEFENLIKDCLVNNIDKNLLLSFTSNFNRYSYAQIDNNKKVIQTAEKNPISNHALVGAYFFARSDEFINAANILLKNCESKEYYTSLLYNILIKTTNTDTYLCKIDEYKSYGTPEELFSNVDKNNIKFDYD